MTTAVSVEAIQSDWKARGFSFGIWVDTPGQQWLDYVHETDELLLLLEGELELEMKESRRRIPVGEEILIPAHTKHSVRNVGSLPNRWLYGYKK